MSALKILHYREAHGDIGPCEHIDCNGRATYVVTFTVDGVASTTWLCTRHHDEFASGEDD